MKWSWMPGAECHFRSGQPKSTPWRNRTTEQAYCSFNHVNENLPLPYLNETKSCYAVIRYNLMHAWVTFIWKKFWLDNRTNENNEDNLTKGDFRIFRVGVSAVKCLFDTSKIWAEDVYNNYFFSSLKVFIGNFSVRMIIERSYFLNFYPSLTRYLHNVLSRNHWRSDWVAWVDNVQGPRS